MKNPAQIIRDALRNHGKPLDYFRNIKQTWWLRTLGFAPISESQQFFRYALEELKDLSGDIELSSKLEKATHQMRDYLLAASRRNSMGRLQIWQPDLDGDVWIAGDQEALQLLRMAIDNALNTPEQAFAISSRSAVSKRIFRVDVQLADSTGMSQS